MIQDLKTIKNLVKKILMEDPPSRDDDTRLLFKVWEAQGFKVPQDIADKITLFCAPPEAIRRTRQKIQEEGSCRGHNYNRRQAESEAVRLWALG